MSNETLGIDAFDEVFRAEYKALSQRRADLPALPVPTPTTANGLTGLALSGGGVRSAAFSLGVLQGLQSKGVVDRADYLSTVSGGGYIGTALSLGMSTNGGTFPFGKTGSDPGETPETRHLRDNSKYLLQNGIPSAISALAIYLRGLVMNALVLMPFLLIGAAFLVALNPDTKRIISSDVVSDNVNGFTGNSAMPFTILGVAVLFALWVVYAIAVSVNQIAPLQRRRFWAQVAAIILILFGVVFVVELHVWLIRAVFVYERQITLAAATPSEPMHVQLVEALFALIKNLVVWIGPLVVVVLPFVKNLAAGATSDSTGGWADLSKRLASRVVLIFAAAIVPLALWLIMMQLAYWGTAVSACPVPEFLRDCTSPDIVDNWSHAPSFLQRTFGASQAVPMAAVHWFTVPARYTLVALLLIGTWPFLSVNANSLHQLYRDRLGSAFLVKRCDPNKEELETADEFLLTKINRQAPYHLINTALNVPGSTFANRRGRNADFFLFSPCYVGSELTGYVKTELAQSAVDGLNIGTAMAISGAAAAPNMGMASIRPLSPTIAFLNVRLGRWVRHPRDIVLWSGKAGAKTNRSFGKPGPTYLLREAFSKSGRTIGETQTRDARYEGFVFLTDGGHIENLGIYELLRRRCSLIIAVDGEADPDLDGGALVRVERFARIDLGVRIAMDWKSIATRTRKVADEVKNKVLDPTHGPHVALGLIDYPPVQDDAGLREKGVLVYIKASLSGDENDYLMAYKAAHTTFPHESTLDQFFSEEQFEVYRALGEHIAARFLDGRDPVAVANDDRTELLEMLRRSIPGASPA
jgi:hypothetical protein